ncbi:MAG: methylmalonyl-CoA mutase family protein [Acidimicrobiaceae bacterium]|nr:methylmalonyl-CoA mutase family protein [Acidimicrobiaceae bacterium]
MGRARGPQLALHDVMDGEPSRRCVGDDWLAEAKRTLRGREPADLATRTRDGIEVRTLYTHSAARPAALLRAAPATVGAAPRWDVRQSHTVTADPDEVDEARQAIAEDLANGVTSVELQVPDGLDADALTALLGGALSGVDPAAAPLALAPHGGIAAAQALVAFAEQNGAPPAPGSSLGLDPLGESASTGQPCDLASAAAWAAQQQSRVVADSGAAGEGLRFFAVDALRYSDAGASEAQVLGWATATGVACLRALVDQGATVDQAAGMIGFRLPATADQFMTVAALRAARVLWARVVTASGGSKASARQYQHAVTAAHMYSRWDRWVNLLRGSGAALAAAVAGADALTVLPFDQAAPSAGAEAALGRRLARNTQTLMLEESHLAWTADPAGGSFYVESLTEQLASAGWRVLQDVEASGGIEAAIAEGALAKSAERSWLARLEALRNREERLTGVSDFTWAAEPAPPDAAASPGRDDGDDRGRALPLRRLAGPFEELRDAARRYQLAHGRRPAAWVAALGSAAQSSPRSAWAQNLLGAGGVEPRLADGLDSPIAAAADFAESGLRVAVITGSDDSYRLRGAATAAALRDAGAVSVALVCDADTPEDLIAGIAAAGDVEIWRDGIDVAAALRSLHRILAVS